MKIFCAICLLFSYNLKIGHNVFYLSQPFSLDYKWSMSIIFCSYYWRTRMGLESYILSLKIFQKSTLESIYNNFSRFWCSSKFLPSLPPSFIVMYVSFPKFLWKIATMQHRRTVRWFGSKGLSSEDGKQKKIEMNVYVWVIQECFCRRRGMEIIGSLILGVKW